MGVLSDLFGKKPNVPALTPVDLGKEQQKAIAENQAALPGAQNLVNASNLFTRQQIEQMLGSQIPGFSGIESNIAGNIASQTKGQIPQDVQDAIERSAVSRAFSGGFAGSGTARNLEARDLGLTSLQLMNQGLSAAESWSRTIDQMFSPGMLNVSSMFISPMQQFGAATEERNMQFQRNWLSNQISAMPDPVTSGLWNTGWHLFDTAMSAYGGGGGASTPPAASPGMNVPQFGSFQPPPGTVFTGSSAYSPGNPAAYSQQYGF